MQVLDREQFDSLRAELAPAVFATLIQSFAEACPVQIYKLTLCARAGDLVGSALAAHQLRGFAANFGAKRLADMAGEIDRACQIADTGALPAMVSDLSVVSRETWAAILACMTPAEG
jgi:HPt (histidine-containing phosphotransfer) domain-containing protein